jgi:hypothetical protein
MHHTLISGFTISLNIFYLHKSCKWDWTQIMTTLVKSFPFYKDINKQKIIVHNGDNYINKFYNMIYLDVNNKVNIKKNKVK